MHVAVIGGGIAGVTAAYRLATSRPDWTTDLYEGADRLGGKLRLGSVAGVTVDLGAESILNRRPEGVEIARVVGLADQVVHPEPVSAAIWTRGAMRPIPPSVMGIPSDPLGGDAVAILGEASHAARPSEVGLSVGDAVDESVGAFVRRRLGAELGGAIVDRLVEPLLGGVYAGRADDLSLHAAAPQIAALGGDMFAAVRLQLARSSGAPVFAGLDGGVGALPQRVADACHANVQLNSTVRRIDRSPVGWRLTVGPTIAAQQINVDAVIVATPAPATSRLLATVAPVAAQQIGGIDYASVAIVTLALPLAGVERSLSGSGFLVPPVDGKTMKAATFSTNKWGWLRALAGDELAVIRCSIGRVGESFVLQRDDEALVSIAVQDLREAIGPFADPIDAHVQRWGRALPQYNVGHRARVDAARSQISDLRGLEVCGAAYEGLGIPAVIADATNAANRVLADFGTMTT